ncbi:MAG: hypothetical protein Kow0074_03770 [Candidatus Zixiibacteriota bacterium]
MRIGAGEYHPDTTIFLRDSIAVIGAGRDSTIIEPDRDYKKLLDFRGPDYPNGGGLLLEGCTMRGLRSSKYNIPHTWGLWINGKTTTPNVIRDNAFYYCDYGAFLEDANVVVHDNYFDSNSIAIDIGFSGPFEIRNNLIRGRKLAKGISTPVFALTRTTVTDNTVIMDQGGGISVKGIEDSVIIANNLVLTGEGMGIWSFCDCAGAVIKNNTVYRFADNDATPVSGFTTWGQSHVRIENNAFVGTDREVMLWQYHGGATRFAHNALWGMGDSINWETAIATTVGFEPEYESNFVGYPMFAWDPVGVLHDSLYRLQRGSQLIDAGNPAILDADGTRSDIGWTGGPGGVAYEYPELPPEPPGWLDLEGDGNVVHLSWEPRHEADLDHYCVYRDVTSGFWAPGLTPLHVIGAGQSALTDTLLSAGESYYYVVTAVDTACLESGPSPEAEHMVTGVFDYPDTEGLPREFGIAGAYPNPFNSATIIEIHSPPSVRSRGGASLIIYDVLGRTVWSSPVQLSESGVTQFSWTARNLYGSMLPSGLYFARLRVGETYLGPATKLIVLK